MKNLTLTLSLTLLALAGATPHAAAQRFDRRSEIPAIINAGREDRQERGGDWQRRARFEIVQLQREVRQVRLEIGDSRNRNLRERFGRIVRSADYLEAAYERGRVRGWEVRQRAEALRSELDGIRRDLRERGRGRRGR